MAVCHGTEVACLEPTSEADEFPAALLCFCTRRDAPIVGRSDFLADDIVVDEMSFEKNVVDELDDDDSHDKKLPEDEDVMAAAAGEAKESSAAGPVVTET